MSEALSPPAHSCSLPTSARGAGAVPHAEELLPPHPHTRRALSPGSPWYRRVVALVLCGLLLTALDCAGPHQESDHPRAQAQTASGPPAATVTSTRPDTPEMVHGAGSCAPLGLAGLSTPRSPAPSRDLAATAGVVPAWAAAPFLAVVRAREEHVDRALSGASRLTVVCRWRI